MLPLPLSRSASRRTLETICAALVILCTVVWIAAPLTLLEKLPVVGPLVGYLWLPVTMISPGVLALLILSGVLAHGVRVSSMVIGGTDLRQPGDTSPTRLLTSLVFGALAATTLWWVVGSFYVLYLAETGGVLFAPLVALVFGSALGVLVLVRTGVRRLFAEKPTSSSADTPQ